MYSQHVFQIWKTGENIIYLNHIKKNKIIYVNTLCIYIVLKCISRWEIIPFSQCKSHSDHSHYAGRYLHGWENEDLVCTFVHAQRHSTGLGSKWDHGSHNSSQMQTLDIFLESVKKTFGDPDRARTARAQLHELKMTPGTTAEDYTAQSDHAPSGTIHPQTSRHTKWTPSHQGNQHWTLPCPHQNQRLRHHGSHPQLHQPRWISHVHLEGTQLRSKSLGGQMGGVRWPSTI